MLHCCIVVYLNVKNQLRALKNTNSMPGLGDFVLSLLGIALNYNCVLGQV